MHVLGVSLFWGQLVSWSVEQLLAKRSGEFYGEVSSVHLYCRHSGNKENAIIREKENQFKKCFTTQGNTRLNSVSFLQDEEERA